MTALARSFVTVDGCRLECECHGTISTAPRTIVFLHEGLGSITQWRDFPAALCARTGFAGLVYNRRGYGGSDPAEPAALPSGFMDREALEVLPQLLEAFKIDHPVLLGHSDGGSIALIYAGSAPESPGALILEAPHVFVEEITVAQIATLKATYSTSQLRRRLARHHGANVDRLFGGWTGVWLSDGFRDWNIEDYLSRISCPTLVIQGRDDEYATLRQVAAIERGIGPHVKTLLLDDCRHAPHVDQRARTEGAVVAFLEELPLQAAPIARPPVPVEVVKAGEDVPEKRRLRDDRST